jgi:hypothetical protein
MRYLMVLAAVVGALLALAGNGARSADKDAGPQSQFFNGRDLTGWVGLKEYWSAKDGAIVGTAGDRKVPFNTFLCSEKTYRDFELRCQVRLKDGKGNSGVQIRSKLSDPKRYAVSGPQCDIGEGYWGSLYGENFGGMMQAAPRDAIKKAVKPADFNDYHVRCVGKHVTIKINGETMVDGDFPKMPDEGIIAWQLHGGHVMEVTFKNIEFKELRGK